MIRKGHIFAVSSPLGVSAGLAGFALGAIVFGGGWGQSLPWLLPIVLCLGMHLLMHRVHGHDVGGGRAGPHESASAAADADAAAIRSGSAPGGRAGKEA